MEFQQQPSMEMLHPPPNMSGPPPNMSQAPPPIAGGGGADFSMPPPMTGAPPDLGHGQPDSGASSGHNGPSTGGAGIPGRGGGHHSFRGGFHRHHGGPGAGTPGAPFFRSFGNYGRGPSAMPMTQDDFDGKRLRKSVMRKTVDYNASIIRALETRVWQRDFRDRRALQPETIYAPEMLPPPSYMDNPTNAVTTRFVKTATNKMRCPIFTLAWTPEGRRLVTGASSGEFTLWNGLTFNFETILQAHDCPVRTMVWSHNDNWMVTGDHQGNVKYWQSNMNNVRAFQAHKDPVRGISFSPSDNKFVSCSDDGTLRVFDFLRCQEEKVLRGHGADVKCVHWHPQKALIVSGSKDNQQPIKLWDPKSGQALATLHAHKSTVMDLKWNDNGNWLITASRDHLLKLFDLRNLKEEVQVFRGHKKEASAVSWHPIHEGLFSSGGSDGSILFWNVGTDKEVGAIDTAHDSIVWTLAWHPLGHILCSGSNDHTIKFWTRNRPGDLMRDKYNLNTLPVGLQGLDDCEMDDNHIIPGMGPEDRIEFAESTTEEPRTDGNIPGLDFDENVSTVRERTGADKKVPYSKPIPRNFQAQWNDTGRPDDDDVDDALKMPRVNPFDGLPDLSVQPPNMGAPPPPIQQPSGIMAYGKTVAVIPGTRLAEAISEGPGALNRFISAGEVSELLDVLPAELLRDAGDPKRPCVDHNVQLIFDQDIRAGGGIGFMPPAMLAMGMPEGVPPPNAMLVSQPPPDFANIVGAPLGMGGADRDGMWSGPPPGHLMSAGQWGAMQPNVVGHMQPNGGPPNWMGGPQGNGGGPDGGEFQNRGHNGGKFGGRRGDGDGRRPTRFDNGNGGNHGRGFGGGGGFNGGRSGGGGFGGGRGGGFGGNGGMNNGPADFGNGSGGGGDFGNRMHNNRNNGGGGNNHHNNNRPPKRRY